MSDEEFFKLHPAEQLALQMENLDKAFRRKVDIRTFYFNGHETELAIKALRAFAEQKKRDSTL